MALKQLIASLLALGLAGTAAAAPSGTGLEGVFDGIATDGDNDVNVYTEMLNDDLDSLWALNSNGQGSSTLIIELAGFADENIFGIYSGSDYIPLVWWLGSKWCQSKTDYWC